MKKYFSVAYLKKKTMETGFRKYFKNTSWMISSKIFSLAVSFLSTLYIIRSLGPANYGQMSYAVSFVALFSFIASVGLDGILFRDLIKSPENRHTLLGTAFFLKLFAGIIAAIAVVMATFFMGEQGVSRSIIIILSFTLPLSAFQIILIEFQSRADSKPTSIASALSIFILSLLKIISIMLGKGIIILSLILVLEQILFGASFIVLYIRKYSIKLLLEWRFKTTTAISLLADSFPMILFSGFQLVNGRIDQIFIKHMIGLSSVGVYDAAVRIAEVGAFMPGTILLALYPAIVNAKKISEELYILRFVKLTLGLGIIGTIVALGVSLFSPLIIKLAYGAEFSQSIYVLQIYVWALVGTSLHLCTTQYLITENKRLGLTLVMCAPMVINVLLNITLIPKFGIIGAAYSTLISYSIAPVSVIMFSSLRSKIYRAAFES